MPTFSSTAIVNIIGSEDSTQNIPINRGATATLDSVFGQTGQSKIVVAGTPVVESIPGGKAFCVFVRNLNAAAGASINLAVTFTGGSIHNIVLGPGDIFLNWSTSINAPAIGGISQGITALTISSGAGTSVYEIYLGG